ncbi:MAG: T9SS type A sorting domain-containing protein [Bacteroidota bacterium]
MKNQIPLFLLLFFCSSLFSQVQLGTDILGADFSDYAGWSVAISDDGNRVAVGAIRNSDNGIFHSGHVRVLEWTNNEWTQVGEAISGLNERDFAGGIIALSNDGNRVAVADINAGTPLSNDGRVRIFEWRDNSWKQMGPDILGVREDEIMGSDISFSQDGNKVAIGAHGHNNKGTFTGRIRVYQWNSANWVPIGGDIDGEQAWDLFGYDLRLSADGNHLIAMSPGYTEFGPDDTYIKVFELVASNNWRQLGETFNLPGIFERTFVNISRDGQRICFNHPKRFAQTEVLTYEWSNGTWVPAGDTIVSDSSTHVISTVSMSDDGQVLAVGVINNEFGSPNRSYIQIYHWRNGNWQRQGENIEIGSSIPNLKLSTNGNRLIQGDYNYDSRRGRAIVYELDGIVSITELPEMAEQLLVFPNPTTEAIQLSRLLQNNEKLTLISTDGRVLRQWSAAHQQPFNIADLPPGIYHLLLENGQQLWQQKIVKQ